MTTTRAMARVEELHAATDNNTVEHLLAAVLEQVALQKEELENFVQQQ